MLYIYVFTISSIFIYLYNLYKSKSKLISELFYFLSFLPIFLIGALRYNVGTDYFSYSVYQIPAYLAGYDVKFEYFNRIIADIGFLLSNGEHYQYIFMLLHLFFTIFIFSAIRKHSSDLILSMYLFLTTSFFNFSMNGMRQAISTAIILYAYKYSETRKIYFFIFLIVAILFHKSSLIYVLFFLINKLKLRFEIYIVISLFTTIILLAFPNSLREVVDIIRFYDEYLGSNFDITEYNITFVFYTVFSHFILILVYYSIPKEALHKFNLEINIMYLSNYIYILMFYIPNGYRLFYSFMPFQIIILPILYQTISNKNKRIANKVFLIVFLALFFIKVILIDNWHATIPYEIFKGW